MGCINSVVVFFYWSVSHSGLFAVLVLAFVCCSLLLFVRGCLVVCGSVCVFVCCAAVGECCDCCFVVDCWLLVCYFDIVFGLRLVLFLVWWVVIWLLGLAVSCACVCGFDLMFGLHGVGGVCVFVIYRW